ncbi:trehalose-phosphatase [Prosthecobacter sp.]|uniref:trehalose-phosphatase n=1 Tax=Prosthecobacter sp. TaxID=1965333 RepID=UPI003785172E
MTPDWTDPATREALHAWLTSQPRILIGCDFDGTIAPLVSHADDARLPIPTRQALQRLMAQPGVALVLISGRSIADLQQRTALEGVLYAGNHGLEMASYEGGTLLAPAAEATVGVLGEVMARLARDLAPLPGVWIEDKRLSASVHYRMAEEGAHAEIEALVRAAVEGVKGLMIRPAKRIWEIRPAIEWDKGTALRWFMSRCQVPSSATAFMGDDVTDLDAFRELEDGWTFMVGAEVDSAARVRLRDPSDTAALVEWMAAVREGARFENVPA